MYGLEQYVIFGISVSLAKSEMEDDNDKNTMLSIVALSKERLYN